MKEDRYTVTIEIIDKDNTKENKELKIEHNENETKENELNLKALIISLIIAICIVCGMFSKNESIKLITWEVIGAIYIIAVVVFALGFTYINRNNIINFIKNMFR